MKPVLLLGSIPAERLSEETSYLDAVRRAGEAVGLADDAVREATTRRLIVERRASRSLRELEALLDMAKGKGAESDVDYARLAESTRTVRALAESGDLLGALDQSLALKPELLALEMRTRR